MSGKPRIPETEYPTIRQRYESGESAAKIATTYAVGLDAVYLILRRKLGIKLRQRGGSSALPEATVEAIKEQYLSGRGSTSIAREFGINKATVFNVMARAGIGTRPQSDRTGNTYHITEARLKAVTSTGRALGSGRRACKKEVNDHAFDTLTDASAYWLGMMITDGCVSDTSAFGEHRIFLRLQWGDRDHIRKFRDFVGSKHEIRKTVAPPCVVGGVEVGERESAVISFVSRHMAETLGRYGVTPRKSQWAVAAPSLINNPHFWRGCMDGDGCLYEPGHKCGYLSGSPGLVGQFAHYVKNVMRLPLGSLQQGSGCVMQWVNSSPEFITSLYGNAPCPIRLERKYRVALKWISQMKNPQAKA